MGYLLIILTNFIYLPALKFGLVSDDAAALQAKPFNVGRAKITSVALHLMVAEYIYFAFGCSNAALISALLFSVHPMTVQISCWKSGEHYGLNALVLLLIIAFPFMFPLYAFSGLSAGSIICTPFVFLFTQYWYIALVFPVIAWFGYKKMLPGIVGKVKGNEDKGGLTPALPEDFTFHKFKWVNLVLVVKTFGYYSLACLLPIKCGFYNSFLVTLGSSKKETDYWYSLNRHFWGGLFAMVLMATLWWFNKTNFIGMGILIFVTSLAPFLNVITVQQQTAPRYVYLPLIGFMIAFVILLVQLPLIISASVIGALFLFYLDRTIQVMKHYAKDNITMIMLDSQVFPDNPRLWYFRYEHMLHKGNSLMAWAEASYGLKHLPEDSQLWFGLAVASFDLGDMNAATKWLQNAETFMMLTDRQQMKGLIEEMRGRIRVKLEEKFKQKPSTPFYKGRGF